MSSRFRDLIMHFSSSNFRFLHLGHGRAIGNLPTAASRTTPPPGVADPEQT
jgi:hypothetical protein